MTDHIKEQLDAVNNIVASGLKSGVEIGRRDAEIRAKPVLDALVAFLALIEDRGRLDDLDAYDCARQARAALAFYLRGKI